MADIDPFDGNRPDPNTGSYNLERTCLLSWDDPEDITEYIDEDTGKPYPVNEHLCLRLKGHTGEHRCGCQATFFVSATIEQP